MLEMFNKSRAQEAKMNIESLKTEHVAIGDKILNLTQELKERCPHPDDFVIKLDSIRNLVANRKTMYLCKLCGTTELKGN